jgi:hypothetical protein
LSGLLLAFCAGGCATSSAYYGTGSLQTSGSPAPVLGSESLALTSCTGDSYDQFSVPTIGDHCVISGSGSGAQFQADAGGLCTLAFPEGNHTFRVTDVIATYGQTPVPQLLDVPDLPRRPAIDMSTIQLRIGGDDVTTGQHLLYQFGGRISDGPDHSAQCDAQRAFHERYIALVGR